jgi:hypothetical protein
VTDGAGAEGSVDGGRDPGSEEGGLFKAAVALASTAFRIVRTESTAAMSAARGTSAIAAVAFRI